MTGETPGAPDRLEGQRLDAGRPTTPAAHPNARFTAPGGAVPVDRARVGGPGRRADRRVPVRRPPRDRRAARARGVRLGARRLPRRDDGVGEDRGRRRHGRRAALRPDRDAAVLRLQHGRLLRALAEDRPSATAPSCPRIFHVNWFRKDDDGKFLWPGFGENSRVLAWIFRRCDGEAEAAETADRLRARARGTSTLDGLDIAAGGSSELLTVDEGARASSTRCASTSPSSATGCRGELGKQFEELSAGWRSTPVGRRI